MSYTKKSLKLQNQMHSSKSIHLVYIYHWKKLGAKCIAPVALKLYFIHRQNSNVATCKSCTFIFGGARSLHPLPTEQLTHSSTLTELLKIILSGSSPCSNWRGPGNVNYPRQRGRNLLIQLLIYYFLLI